MICAANWKLNKSPREAEAFLRDLRRNLSIDHHQEVIIFPSAICLMLTGEVLEGTDIGWGAQNCYFEKSGAFTGENSPEVLRELGATHCLVGHSERRSLFHETNSDCAKKVAAIQGAGMVPMLCVGETLEQREKGQTNSVIVQQLREGLQHVHLEKEFWLAYEPVWAIGTGKVATPAQANEAHLVLRNELTAVFGASKARTVPILYGGSVKPENAHELAQQPELDGFLIGGASLQLESLLKIHSEANR
ncbi:MAG: triose-phosphate isomerase [Bdellovibrionales bacterium]|nr:triose-phosphate isomerase [Bdellovibrionales bacterium]